MTTFIWYDNTSANGLNRGMLKQIINGLNHTTTFSNYNGFGKPQTVVDANNVTTTYVYDDAGRMTSKTFAGKTTDFIYDDAGNLTELHLPGKVDIFYQYTDANLLERVTDNQNNYIKYIYDTEGSKTREEIWDNDNNLKKYTDYQFDDYNRLHKVVNLSVHETVLDYDDNNNLEHVKEPDNDEIDYGHDPLNRLISITRSGTLTEYEYNPFDYLTNVTDPENNETIYTVDDFGRTGPVNSQDTGITDYSYDNADNLVTINDPRPNTTSFVYDDLNRLTNVNFVAHPVENISYT